MAAARLLPAALLAALAGCASRPGPPPPLVDAIVCGQQAPPPGETWTITLNDGPPQPVSFVTPADPRCAPHAATHSAMVRVPATGPLRLRVAATNAFGTTPGPVFLVRP